MHRLEALGPNVPFKTSDLDTKAHTLDTIVPALDTACADVEAEAARLEAETEASIAELTEIVGSLSDLRYGRLPKDARGRDLLDEAADALKSLREEGGENVP